MTLQKKSVGSSVGGKSCMQTTCCPTSAFLVVFLLFTAVKGDSEGLSLYKDVAVLDRGDKSSDAAGAELIDWVKAAGGEARYTLIASLLPTQAVFVKLSSCQVSGSAAEVQARQRHISNASSNAPLSPCCY